MTHFNHKKDPRKERLDRTMNQVLDNQRLSSKIPLQTPVREEESDTSWWDGLYDMIMEVKTQSDMPPIKKYVHTKVQAEVRKALEEVAEEMNLMLGHERKPHDDEECVTCDILDIITSKGKEI